MFSFHSEADLLMGLLLLLVLAGLTGYYANNKGKNGIFWFFMTLLIGIIAPVILYFLPVVKSAGKKPVEPPPQPSFQPESTASVPSQIEISDSWYYLNTEHQQSGPVPLFELLKLKDQGVIQADTYVWREGMAAWEKIETCQGIKERTSPVKMP